MIINDKINPDSSNSQACSYMEDFIEGVRKNISRHLMGKEDAPKNGEF